MEKTNNSGAIIIQNFINTNYIKDRLHTDTICQILNDNEYKLTLQKQEKMMNRVGIDIYNSICNIDKCRKGGFEYIK